MKLSSIVGISIVCSKCFLTYLEWLGFALLYTLISWCDNIFW